MGSKGLLCSIREGKGRVAVGVAQRGSDRGKRRKKPQERQGEYRGKREKEEEGRRQEREREGDSDEREGRSERFESKRGR